MADAIPPPPDPDGGATTVPPAQDGEALPNQGPPPAAEVTIVRRRPPVAVPFKRRWLPRRSFRWWFGRALPVVGLALFVLALNGLFDRLESPGHDSNSPENDRSFDRPGRSGAISVVLDPGHGGVDSGAVALGLQEKTLTLDVALRVASILESRDYHVRLTRTSDQTVSLEDRVRVGNGLPGAIFVSIHFNDAPEAARGQAYHASGIETFYSEHKQLGPAGDWLWTSLFGRRGAGPAVQRDALVSAERESAVLADAIQASLVVATAAADRGTKERALYVTRRVWAPAVLVEGGFISHPSEAKHLGESTYRQKLAEAIAAGIVKYLRASAARADPSGHRGAPAGA